MANNPAHDLSTWSDAELQSLRTEALAIVAACDKTIAERERDKTASTLELLLRRPVTLAPLESVPTSVPAIVPAPINRPTAGQKVDVQF